MTQKFLYLPRPKRSWVADDFVEDVFGEAEPFFPCWAGEEDPLLLLPGAFGRGFGDALFVLLEFRLPLIGAGNSTDPLTDFFSRFFLICFSSSKSQFGVGGIGGSTHSLAMYFLASYFARMNCSREESVCGLLKLSGKLASYTALALLFPICCIH